ncbi:LysR family transcriptional regulator [Ignatzschineria indica]|uniref:Hydrogen peroxide-inducible genes activator n=1 Tax=Ignatzschineria indica TaxID=472583 RepID=A0A2U2AI00_9GAMM|nr:MULTISPECIES: LysR substrate-binding domain-containing protein [Ignatzschineria]OYQ77295.1 DNA-binding transcriptional regulator OxyR [Ignatzschineria sp. F8392]PWD82209.1 hydrogen peroxide-inducible genes activator [Ignatzschineria indica]GGZ88686.1 LysR family transcriptional regulator [Ignatzschineria indica]
MKLNELRYFIAVAEERHFGRAAQKCFISQPALSIGIKNLEASMDVSLFERTTNEVLLTPEGEKALPKARKIFELVDELLSLSKESDSIEGRFNLGIIFTIAPYLLPRMIPLLREAAPELQLNLFENMTDNLLPMLKTGEIDAAILALPIADPTFEVIELYEEPFFVITPKEHPLNEKEVISPDEIHEYDPLLLNIGHCFRDQVLDRCKEINATSSHHHSLETIRNIVAAGHQISVLPKYALTDDHLSELLHYIPFTEPVPTRKVALVYRKEFTQMKKIETIAKCIKDLNL